MVAVTPGPGEPVLYGLWGHYTHMATDKDAEKTPIPLKKKRKEKERENQGNWEMETRDSEMYQGECINLSLKSRQVLIIMFNLI